MRLDVVGTTTSFLTPELKTVLTAQVITRASAGAHAPSCVIPWLFPHFDDEPRSASR